VARAGADGEAAGSTGDSGGVERATAAGRGGLGAAALWPPSTTASVIATPAAMETPAKTAAPDRKLISSMRALIVCLSRSNPWSSLSRHSTIQGYRPVRGQARPRLPHGSVEHGVSTVVPCDRPDLDRAVPGGRVLRRYLDGLVEIGAVDHVVPGDLLLGLWMDRR
jgi:hypothetical protein